MVEYSCVSFSFSLYKEIVALIEDRGNCHFSVRRCFQSGDISLPDRVAQLYNIVLQKCVPRGKLIPEEKRFPTSVEVRCCLEVADERWSPHEVIGQNDHSKTQGQPAGHQRPEKTN